MSELKLDSAVERVTFLGKDDKTGLFYVSSVFRNEGGKKKASKLLRPVEKLVRRLNKTQALSASLYRERHERSSRKKKNGWLSDIVTNMRKAQKSAWKSTEK